MERRARKVAAMNRLAPLSASFVVLAALIVWREAGRGATTSLSTEANLHPFAARTFTPDDVGKIEVTPPGGDKPAYTLVREDKAWRVVGDFKAPASGAAVTKLLDVLAKAEGEFRADDKAVLDQYDLARAGAVDVRVYDKDGKDLVHVGVGKTSGSQGAFVRDLVADDSKAYVVTGDVRGLLGLGRSSAGQPAEAPKPGHFHDKEFPRFALDKTKKIELATPGRVVAFEKDDKGAWKVAAGGPDAPVKKDGVESALRSLSGGMRPTALLDPAKKSELGFDKPTYRLSVTGDDGVSHVAVGATDSKAEHFYVRLDVQQDPDVLYEASEYEFHQLFPAGSTLFELPRIDSKDQPTRVVVERKGRDKIELTRKGTKPGDDWSVVAPKWPLEPKQSSLRGMASSISSVHVSDYVDDATLPEAEVVVRWGSAAGAEDQLKTLSVDGKAPAGKDRLATLPGKAGRVYMIGESVVDRLAPEPFSLFEPKLFKSWNKDDVTVIRVAGGPTIKRHGEDWKVIAAEGAPEAVGEKAAVEAWLDKFLGLELTGVAPAGADEGAATVVIERFAGTPLTFDVTPAKDGKRVVKVGEFRATANDVTGLLPDAASLLPKPPEPPKKDDEPKTDEPKKDEEKK
jgi:hypothetical protein